MVFENVEYLIGKLPCNQFMEMYYMCAGTILGITDYFWRVSPSDKKTVKLCQSWVDYANACQPIIKRFPSERQYELSFWGISNGQSRFCLNLKNYSKKN